MVQAGVASKFIVFDCKIKCKVSVEESTSQFRKGRETLS